MDEVIFGNFGSPSTHIVVNSFSADEAGYVSANYSLHDKFYINCHFVDIRAKASPFAENSNGYGMLTTAHFDKVRYIDIQAIADSYETDPSVDYTFGGALSNEMSIKSSDYTGFDSTTHKMQVYRVKEIITTGPNAITIKFGAGSDDDVQTKEQFDKYISDHDVDELEAPNLLFVHSKGMNTWDHAIQVMPRTTVYLSVPDMGASDSQVTVGIQGFYSRY